MEEELLELDVDIEDEDDDEEVDIEDELLELEVDIEDDDDDEEVDILELLELDVEIEDEDDVEIEDDELSSSPSNSCRTNADPSPYRTVTSLPLDVYRHALPSSYCGSETAIR